VKDLLAHITPAFENRIRLVIMSMLMVNDSLDFTTLKQSLAVTDGNLASHISTLEQNKFIVVKKKFIGKKPFTSYAATKAGRLAFAEHLGALEKIIRRAG
jgi:DNA-binding HxlR family transcriptional regulator